MVVLSVGWILCWIVLFCGVRVNCCWMWLMCVMLLLVLGVIGLV